MLSMLIRKLEETGHNFHEIDFKSVHHMYVQVLLTQQIDLGCGGSTLKSHVYSR